jgi:hypothetical protein
MDNILMEGTVMLEEQSGRVWTSPEYAQAKWVIWQGIQNS